MLKVGNTGEKGTVEMQDLLLTTKGGTAGVVLMEWNVAADHQGSAALWGEILCLFLCYFISIYKFLQMFTHESVAQPDLA